MPKNKIELNDNEKKVINALLKNARETAVKLSKKTGLSRQTVQKTIQGLEKDHVIWGYTAIIDNKKIGRKRFFILLKRTHKPVSDEKVNIVVKREMRKYAIKMGVELEDSYYINGLYDWLMSIKADDIKQVKRFCNSFSSVFQGLYLSDIQILEVLFPVEKNGFDNPKRKELEKFF